MTDGCGGQRGGNKAPRGLLVKLTGLLTALASGLVLGKLPNDVSYRGVVIIVAYASILTAVIHLRQVPGRSRLGRASSGTALMLASGCAVLAVIFLSPWSEYAVLGATLFTVAATVLLLDRYHVARTLGGIAIIGMGISLAGDAVSFLQELSDPMMTLFMSILITGQFNLDNALTEAEITEIGVAISFIGAGIALLLRRDTLLGAAGVCLGVSLIGGGIMAQPLIGPISSLPAWFIAAGAVAAIGAGVAFPLVRNPLLGAASIGLGLVFVGTAIFPLVLSGKNGDVSVGFGIWLILTGVVSIGAGIVFLFARGRLIGVAGIGLGLSLISGAVAAQLSGFTYTSLAVSLIIAGAVAVGAGVVFLFAQGRLVSVAGIALALSLISGGVVALMVQDPELLLIEGLLEGKLIGAVASTVIIGAWIAIGAGVAALSTGLALPLARSTLTGIAGICLGISLVGAGIEGERTTLIPLFSAWLIAVGVSLVGFTIARLRDRWRVLSGVAVISAGISLAVPAVEFFLDEELLGGVAAIGAVIALVALGVSIIVHPYELRRWLAHQWEIWTRAPSEPDK